jgi:hypothetical protein
MADTMRSLATLATLLADNASGAISAQDLRDAVLATIQPGHGEISVTSSAETTISAVDTWYDAAGTFALSSNAMNWDMNTNGQLRYTGAAGRVAHIAASFSMTAAGNNKNMSLCVAKNGTAITPSIVNRLIGTGTDEGTGAMHAFIDMTTNDYLTVQIRNNTDNVNATLTTVNLFAMDMAT